MGKVSVCMLTPVDHEIEVDDELMDRIIAKRNKLNCMSWIDEPDAMEKLDNEIEVLEQQIWEIVRAKAHALRNEGIVSEVQIITSYEYPGYYCEM